MKKNIYIENYIVVKVDLVYLLLVYGLFIFYFLYVCYIDNKIFRVDNFFFKFYILVLNDY